MIRLEEGVLRKRQVLGKDHEPKSQHEALQVQLNKGMQAFELQNVRCSRAKAWQTFTRLVQPMLQQFCLAKRQLNLPAL